MEQATARAIANEYDSGVTRSTLQSEANSSGVSWAAVIAGGSVTAATCLSLLSLGAGLGLSSVSLWSNAGAAASTIGSAAILWMILMQIVSSSFGGYLAGRLRTKWTSIHSDEVYFRDTAHGFLTWALSLIVTAAFLASAGASMMGIAASSGGAAARAATNDERPGGESYFVDTLLRSNGPDLDANVSSVRSEVGMLFANALKQGAFSREDQNYLDRVIMARTGLKEADADSRVSAVFTRAKQDTEAIRKATAHLLLWTFVSLLTGAFCASFAGTIGGRQRDRVVAA